MSTMQRLKNDWKVVMGVFVVLAAVYGAIFYNTSARFKEDILINELRSMRLGVDTFQVMNGRLPKDLSELAGAFFKSGTGARPPLISMQIQRRNFRDPFGNDYIYDPKSGWVMTLTDKYRDW